MKTNTLLMLLPSSAAAFVRSDREDFGARRGFLKILGKALHHAGHALTRGHRRRASIAQLRRLSDRGLTDLGIRREQVPTVVDRMLERESGDGVRQRPEPVAGSDPRQYRRATRSPS